MHMIFTYVILFCLVLYNWINKSTPNDFGFILQNNWIKVRVVGVESFSDGKPLTLQLQVSSLILELYIASY